VGEGRVFFVGNHRAFTEKRRRMENIYYYLTAKAKSRMDINLTIRHLLTDRVSNRTFIAAI
jgi:hypothetical protein